MNCSKPARLPERRPNGYRVYDYADRQRLVLLQQLQAGGLSLKDWHEEIERMAPDLHRQWLMTQGFTSDDAARVT